MPAASNSHAPNFDHIARPYRWLEYLTFGRQLEQTRFHYLPNLTSSRNALVLGDGDGRFLTRLLHQNPQLQATAVDISPAMLHQLQHRCHADHRLTLIQTDIRNFTPAATTQFDLIVTHFFLDCLTEPEIAALESRLQPHLQPETLWLISEFAIPSNPILRAPAQLLIRALYAAFAILTGLKIARLPNHRRILQTAGWQCIAQQSHARGLLTSELWRK